MNKEKVIRIIKRGLRYYHDELELAGEYEDKEEVELIMGNLDKLITLNEELK